MQKTINWAKNLHTLGNRFEINFNHSENNVSWTNKINILLECLQNEFRDNMWEKARPAVRFIKN